MGSPTYDKLYKRLFSNPRIIERLLYSFVSEELADKLDFSTLKRIDRTMVSESFQERTCDLIVRISYRDSGIQERGCVDGSNFLFILIEFQTTVDREMPLRFSRYIGEFYENLNHGIMKSNEYPNLLPILLYTGERRWTVPDSIPYTREDRFLKHYTFLTALHSYPPPAVGIF